MEANTIKVLLAAGRAAVEKCAAASDAALKASQAAATAADSAKLALEEVEKLVGVFEESRKSTKDKVTRSPVPSGEINPGERNNDAKDRGSITGKVSQIFKQLFSRKETVVDGVKYIPPASSTGCHSQQHTLHSFELATETESSTLQGAPNNKSDQVTSRGESATSLPNNENLEQPGLKSYSRDFLLSFQSHPIAMKRPQSTDPLVLPEMNEMTRQMIRDFPDEMSTTCHELPTGYSGKPSGIEMIKTMKSQALVVPDEPLQVCQAVGLFILKQEYRQLLPDLQGSMSHRVKKSFNNALSYMDSIFCESLKETSEPLPMFPDDHPQIYIRSTISAVGGARAWGRSWQKRPVRPF